jgi:transcriptional repressor NrdR
LLFELRKDKYFLGGILICPECKSKNLSVIDTREVDEVSIRRRRECGKCGHRFTTYEYVEAPHLFIIKKDGRREPFSKEKLAKGIWKSCEKRPISQSDVESIISNIEKELRAIGESELKSNVVGEKVMEKLKNLDKVAYIRFASVYREFKDVEEIKKEIEKLT